MTTTSTDAHPLDKLTHGEVRTLPEAVSVLTEAIHWERAQAGDDLMLADALHEALMAQVTYFEVMTKARREAIGALRNVGLTDWADALETGDYSHVAF